MGLSSLLSTQPTASGTRLSLATTTAAVQSAGEGGARRMRRAAALWSPGLAAVLLLRLQGSLAGAAAPRLAILLPRPRCCRLISSCVLEARRRGVQPHKVATYVRRRLGGGVAILRFRADGTPGCSAPCTLCARELLKYDLKVACLMENGQVFCGRLTDPGAPPAKVTGGQRAWLTYWASCQRRPNTSGGANAGSGSGDAANVPPPALRGSPPPGRRGSPG